MTRATLARIAAKRRHDSGHRALPPTPPMKASQFFISTLKEAPADAEVVSHQLMMRAGMIKRLGAGIYTYMPMGLRVIRKVEAIVREEMNRAGAVELLMPVVQPAELWQETGRLGEDGPRADARQGPARPRLRHPADQRGGHHRHRAPGDAQLPQLPKNFYHIQTKFRDERRPRFGVMRGREFTMKDAYSFDRDVDGGQGELPTRCTTPTCASSTRLGLTLPRRGGRHRRDRRRSLARVPGDRRHRRGRDRLLPRLATTPPTSRWPRRWRRPARRAAPTQAAGEDADARQEHLRGRRRAARPAAGATVKSLVLATDQQDDAGDVAEPRSGCCWCAATTN